MTTARELYTEARRLREFARTLDEDSEVWAAVQELIVELERRARQLYDGDGRDAGIFDTSSFPRGADNR